MKAIFILQVFLGWTYCKDNFTINFIKSFIENEDKPTHLVYNGLCWGKKLEVTLVNKVSESGICSSSLAAKSKFQDHAVLFLVDLTCPESSDLLLHTTSERLFQLPFRWLILSAKGVDPVNTTLWSLPILVNSELVLAENLGEQLFILTELHKPSMNQSMLLTPRGYYNGMLVDTRPHRELYRRRKNLMGHPLTMANVIQDNNDTKEHIRRGDMLELRHDAVTRLCWIAAEHAFEMLNATPQYIFSYRWGYKVDGRWSGMIHDLETNRADLGTNCVTFAERLDVAVFIDLVAPLRISFVFRQPPLAYVSNIFTLPFSGSVWLAIAVCVAAATVTLYLTSKWENSVKSSPSQLDGSIGDALLLTLSAVAQQGCFFEPRRAPGRIMEWFLFTALMALYAAYSANIVVLLQAPSSAIRSLGQLADSKITLAANDVDYSRFVFSPYKDPTHVKISRRVIPENGKPEFYSLNDGVERIRQGMFAFHSVVEPLYRRIEETFLETEKCDLSEVEFISRFGVYTPVKKDSPYLEIIRVVYKQIRESGLQSALVKRIQVAKPRCSNKVSAFNSVGLLDLRPVLVFMLYGAALSVLLLLAEILYSKHTR